MSRKHANISIFVPHIGCPNRCSFCDQRSITGSCRAPRPDDVIEAVRNAVRSKNYDPENTEIAFFGGSFTAINRTYMTHLLQAASGFVEEGVVSGIRISTRPDAVDEEILTLLKKHHVKAIELGAQSLDAGVLRLNNRGHSVSDVIRASEMIKNRGFELGLQMMTGLFGDNDDKAIRTAEKIIEIHPDTVRIYPTIVLHNTDLEVLYNDKKYSPQTLDEAVSLAVRLLELFEQSGIKVIRLGLHSIEQGSYAAGPWHPAFSELCSSERYFRLALKELKESGNYNLYVNPSEISKMTGQKKCNISRLAEKGFVCRVLPDAALAPFIIKTERIDQGNAVKLHSGSGF